MRSSGALLLILSFATSTALAQSTPTFQAGATNVLVDVVVIGPHNAPVDNLSKDSFAVLEDGKVQQIVSFEAHSPSTVPVATQQPKLAAGEYTNAQTVRDNSVDVLLIDALNTPNANQVQTHQKLLAYLKNLPLNKPVAVFLLNTHLHQIEDFTTDHTALLEAVEGATRTAHTSPLLKTARDTEHELKDEDDLLELSLATKKPGVGMMMMRQLQQFNAEQDSFNINLRVQYTLAALTQLAGYLSGMPGRKNLLWLSGSFPLAVLPDFNLKNSSDSARDFSVQVDRTASLLAKARVAVYPIDARGLFPQPLSPASISGGSAVRNPDRVDAAESADQSQHSEERLTLEEMAHVTGGEAITNTNDLKAALGEVDRDGEHYYTLAYHPSNTAQNDRLRRIDVRVQPGHYHLAYRRSYVAGPPLRADDTFPIALQHDVPASTQILFRLTPVSAGVQPPSAPLQGSNPNVRRPVTRYNVAYDVDVSSLQLNPANGVLQDRLTLVVIAYDRNGTPLNSTSNALDLHVPEASYAQFVKQGIQYPQQLDIPTQAAWLRAGILDQNSGEVGSIEVPLMVAH